MAKADGEKIAIQFDEELLGIGNAASAFTVSFAQYNMVPGGSLVQTSRTVTSAELDENDAHILYLNFGKGNTRSLRNARGNIVVAYNAEVGRLYGVGGPVQSFTEEFTPDGLEAKDNPLATEHIEMSASATGTLYRMWYHNGKITDHIEMSVSGTGNLTYIGDL